MWSFLQLRTSAPIFMGSSFQRQAHNLAHKAGSKRRDTILAPRKRLDLERRWEVTENRGGVIRMKRNGASCSAFLFPVDPWAPNIDSQSIASQLFAFSLFPYLGFLYFITKSKSAPRLTLFGFYFLLAFVGATIPAGIYAKVHYGTSLSNVDSLHGGAESLLTLTNIFIVLGLRGAIRKAQRKNGEESSSDSASGVTEEKSSV